MWELVSIIPQLFGRIHLWNQLGLISFWRNLIVRQFSTRDTGLSYYFSPHTNYGCLCILKDCSIFFLIIKVVGIKLSKFLFIILLMFMKLVLMFMRFVEMIPLSFFMLIFYVFFINLLRGLSTVLILLKKLLLFSLIFFSLLLSCFYFIWFCYYVRYCFFFFYYFRLKFIIFLCSNMEI